MKRFWYRVSSLVFLTSLMTSCATSGVSYWIPPSNLSQSTSTVEPISIDPVASNTAIILPTLAPSTNPSGALPSQTQPPLSFPTELTPFIPPTPAPPTSTPEISVPNTAPILYYAQAADTLTVVAVRYGVLLTEIASTEPIPASGFLNPGQLLIIPRRLTNTTSSKHLLPDSEVVYSPSAIGFDGADYARKAGGYLATFEEWHKSTGLKSGGEIVMRVALENSINPRLLMALLEYHSHWVLGEPVTQQQLEYPMDVVSMTDKGLFNQLVESVNQLSIGYYAYREGRLTQITFSDGVTTRLAPDLNAGTAALQYYFAQHYSGQRWLDALDPNTGFPALYATLFGNPWERSLTVEPLYPKGVEQPPLTLPFGRNWVWAYTGGPHGAWERDGAYAALDFAPGSTQPGCVESPAWVVAASAGLVVRTGPGLVVLDLDGDGYEQTGWVLLYLHVATKDRIPVGSWVAAGDPLGHASCEGGYATGTHLHIARKFNGEWVPADGPLPFNLGGWIAHYSGAAYRGTLTRDGVTVTACVCSNAASFVTRTDSDP
jgi:LasA protease